MMNIIKMPVLTEKSIAKYKDEGKATFEVDVNSNKKSAAKALEASYGVSVVEVKVNSRMGKYKVNRTNRKLIKREDKKIMIFKLADSNKIDIFEEASK
ncbi:MAG: 50S ribosomal protein L23 [Candidatus Dojkabacteria bacterium]